MCGIAGAFRIGIGTDDRVAEGMRAATRSLTHRGPDDHGIVRRDHVVLAHQRLSIIDLSACGHQPMTNESGDVWVSYNGEIYNHGDLRAALIATGHTFRSSSDTEVLIHGFEEWGITGLLDRLRGMFAFALHDARPRTAGGHPSGTMYLARDRFGIKPLYYAELEDDGVVFASETRALLASGLVDSAVDARAATGFLLFGSVPSPYTTRRHIHALPPGHFLTLGPQPRLTRYYDAPRLFADRDEREGCDLDAVRALLQDATNVHLLSDAPIGVFLSGGIDSSVLVGLASAGRANLRTVSIVFDDPCYSERPYQLLVRERFRTSHHEVAVTAAEMAEALPSFFAAMDQPTIDGLNTYFVARAARDAGLKVVLSGLGGDEVFGGYETIRRAPALQRVQRLPSFVVRAFARSAPRRYARKLELLADSSAVSLYLAQRGLFAPREVAELLGVEEHEAWQVVHERDGTEGSDPGLLQQRLEFTHYLPDQLLRDADVFGMAHSIEIRVPFLDHILVERMVAMAQPRNDDGQRWPKALLTRATTDLLPPEIVFRPKQGFTFPFRPWLATGRVPIHDAMETSTAARRVWHAFLKGREHWARPWALAVLHHFAPLS